MPKYKITHKTLKSLTKDQENTIIKNIVKKLKTRFISEFNSAYYNNSIGYLRISWKKGASRFKDVYTKYYTIPRDSTERIIKGVNKHVI